LCHLKLIKLPYTDNFLTHFHLYLPRFTIIYCIERYLRRGI